MNKLNLAFLSDAIYPYHHGGKETLQYERAVRLARRGHAVRVHTMHWWPEKHAEVVHDGIALHAISPQVPLYTRKGGRSIWQSIVVGLGSLRLLWSAPFDLLDVDQFPFTPFFAARLVCWIRRRPMTATWYEVWDAAYWREYMGWLGPVGFWLQRLAARSADRIFADSRLTARRLTQWLGVDMQRVTLLSPGTVVDPPSDAPQRKMVDCIVIGRQLRHKHLDVFLLAMATLPAVTGLVVGSGPEHERLVELAQDLGITDRIKFESPDSHEAVLARLRASRLLVFPSTREGFGMAVLEANACGVPALVIQHADNAALELVRPGETGLVCELHPEAIATAIRTYLADDLAQARMSSAAQAFAAGFTWDSYVERMEAALMSFASPPAPAPVPEKAA
jgi:glycosyltransferase involved in cell wall biosynthesis